jgi:dsDNA-specific endonuclease/ATPase MutS2
MNDSTQPDPPHHLPIDGTLDLHLFQPSDVGTLIDEYIDACLEKGICEIRIIHGKGTGQLRRSVHHLLERNDHVEWFGAGGDKTNWGVTTARLRGRGP